MAIFVVKRRGPWALVPLIRIQLPTIVKKIRHLLDSLFSGSHVSSEPAAAPDLPGESQFVLSVSATDDTTSNVTPALVADTITSLRQGYVDLIRCRALSTPHGVCRTFRWGYAEGRDEPAMHIFVDDGEDRLRFTAPDLVGPDVAVRLFNAFLSRDEVPSLDTWTEEILMRPAEPAAPLVLDVDGREFSRPLFDDVEAALEKLSGGRARCITLYTGEFLDGYIEVAFSRNAYDVEIKGFCAPGTMRRFRTSTPYGGHVMRWLNDYFNRRVFPVVDSAWEECGED